MGSLNKIVAGAKNFYNGFRLVLEYRDLPILIERYNNIDVGFLKPNGYCIYRVFFLLFRDAIWPRWQCSICRGFGVQPPPLVPLDPQVFIDPPLVKSKIHQKYIAAPLVLLDSTCFWGPTKFA